MNGGSESRKRYVLVGTGSRSQMFSEALLGTYKSSCELVAICDTSEQRMAYMNARFGKKFGIKPLPAYRASDFDRMVNKEKPDVVIVCTVDRIHHHYIICAMEMGCDVVTEKPLTIDAEKCQAIVDTVKRTGRDLRVAFNYRYSPARTKVKSLLMEGVIGDVKSIHFEWFLDTTHGADYFRRWHRDKANSGGLMVHKSTHHFDLVNWWLSDSPQTVFGFGSLAFYGRTNGEKRGAYRPYYRSTGHPAAEGDPYALNLRDGGSLEGMYFKAEKDDGYLRDQNVFGDGINIEDTMNLVVRYRRGAQLSYTLTAYAPCEGSRIIFTGTKGRIELDDMERSYISRGNSHVDDGISEGQRILVRPQWDKPYQVDLPKSQGGHGGGDSLLLEDLFSSKKKKKDPYGRASNYIDGAQSILTGIAANQCFATGLPVRIADLVQF